MNLPTHKNLQSCYFYNMVKESTTVTLQFFYNAMFGSIEMDSVVGFSGSCNKGTILQRIYRKMTISWLFS